MRDFTNEKVGKEYKNFKKMLYISLVVIVLANLVFAWYATKKTVALHELIVGNSKSNTKSYIDVTDVSSAFAYYPGEVNKFYFVMDQDDYIYIVRMSQSDYSKISKSVDASVTYKVEGATKDTPSDIKKLAIEAYNESVDEEYQITSDDFEEYFGSIYLDTEAIAFDAMDVIMVIAAFGALFGVCFGLYGAISIWRFKRKINKLSVDEREMIDKEMNATEAFYYKNAHMYLTENYIVNFASTFDAIAYKDVIWVYKFIQRRNGIKASQSIIVMTKNGKSHTIATLSGLTKKANDVFEEILQTVAQKSTNAVVGYTSENRRAAKEKIEK